MVTWLCLEFFYFLLELSFLTSLPSGSAAVLYAPALVVDVYAYVHVFRGRGIAEGERRGEVWGGSC